MPEAVTLDLLRGYSFVADFGTARIGFMEVEQVSLEVESEDIRECTNPFASTKIPTQIVYPNLVLRRGRALDNDFWTWFMQVSGKRPGPFKRDGIIRVIDYGSQATLLTWEIAKAWPVAYRTAGLSAMQSNLLFDTIELACEGIQESPKARERVGVGASPAPSSVGAGLGGSVGAGL